MAFKHGVQCVELTLGAIVPGGQGEQDAAEEGEICPVALLSAFRSVGMNAVLVNCA